MKKITLRRIVSVSLVGMMLFVSAGTPWGKIPVIFAANSSITSPTAPQLTLLDDKLVLQTDLSGNSIANGGDILRLEVAINNQDDIDAADACATSGTSVTADLSTYVSTYSNIGTPSAVGLTRDFCGDGSNQIWSIDFTIASFTELSGDGLDVLANDIASKVTVSATDNDETLPVSNISNALGDGVVDTLATGGVDNIRPVVTNITFSPTTILEADTVLIVTVDYSDDMYTGCLGYPYLSFENLGYNGQPFGGYTCPGSFNWITNSQVEITLSISDVDLFQAPVAVGTYTNGHRDAAGNYLTAFDYYESGFFFDLIDQVNVTISSAQITSGNILTVTFSDQVNVGLIDISAFNSFRITGEGVDRNITNINSAGNPIIELTFDGAAVTLADTATLDVNSGTIFDLNGNAFATVISKAVISQNGLPEVWIDDNFGPGNAGGHIWGIEAYATVQEGLDIVDEGGVVHVAAGTYNEVFTISKSLTLLGDPGDSAAGPGVNAPILEGGCDTRTLGVDVADVTISGIILQNSCDWENLFIGSVSGVTVTDIESRNTYIGVAFESGSNLNTVTNSLFHDFTYTGASFNNGSENNIFSNNIIGNDTGILLCDTWGGSGIYVDSNVSGAFIINNEITGYPCPGIITWSYDNVGIHNNVISGNLSGITYNGGTPIDATMNYWGDASGPYNATTNALAIGGEVSDDVTYTPWFTDAGLTTLNSYQSIPIATTAPIELNLSEVNEGTLLDLNNLLTDIGGGILAGVIPQMTINATTSLGVITVQIPSGTTVTGAAGWDGTIQTPTIKPNSSVTVNGTVQSVVEVGFPDVEITFDKGVRLLITGQGGKLVGYSRNNVFTIIDDICADDTQVTGDALPAGGDCHIDVNADADKAVWTKHFTSFVTYTSSAGGGRRGSIACGDGVIQAPNSYGQNETCDDGNTNSGDGCSSICLVEVVSGGGGSGGSGSGNLGSAPVPVPAASENVPTGTIGQTVAPVAVTLRDVMGSPEEDAILRLILRGIIHGHPDGTFRPLTVLNRAGASKMIALLIAITPDQARDGDLWYSGLHRALINAGIINGTVSPDSLEYRANFLAFIVKAKGLLIDTLPACEAQRLTDVAPDTWYCPVVEHAVSEGWIRETSGEFDPTGVVLRGWAAGVLDRAFP